MRKTTNDENLIQQNHHDSITGWEQKFQNCPNSSLSFVDEKRTNQSIRFNQNRTKQNSFVCVRWFDRRFYLLIILTWIHRTSFFQFLNFPFSIDSFSFITAKRQKSMDGISTTTNISQDTIHNSTISCSIDLIIKVNMVDMICDYQYEKERERN